MVSKGSIKHRKLLINSVLIIVFIACILGPQTVMAQNGGNQPHKSNTPGLSQDSEELASDHSPSNLLFTILSDIPPLPPSITVDLYLNSISGIPWRGDTVTISVDDPQNGVGEDYSITVETSGIAGYPGYTSFLANNLGIQLVPGMIVTVTDDSDSVIMTIANVIVAYINTETDVVSGIADPGTTVGVSASDDVSFGYRSATADANGNWSVDFSTDSPILDLMPRSAIFATIFDDYGNCTEFGVYIPKLDTLSPQSVLAGSSEFMLVVNGSYIMPNAVVKWNGEDRPTKYVNSTQITVSIPSSDIDAIGSAKITIADPGIVGAISNEIQINIHTFADALPGAWYYRYVEGFYAKGITTGCANGPYRYCPDRAVTRAEMAVFILRSLHADALPYTPAPDPADVDVFADVPVATKEWMKPWIEEFYGTGMTTGCATDPLRYCPERQVTRAEMAVFVLRAIHGADYQPPAVSVSSFSDVPVAGKGWMMPWIEEFYAEGLTTGCKQKPTLQYCPEQSVTRAEMATFLDRAFGFPQLP